MGNLTTGLKKFLANKNTVTVLGVAIAIIVLYIGYTTTVNSATNPVPVPYAKETISAGVQITSDMVGIMEVPSAALKGGVLTQSGQVIDKYSNDDSIIPEGSLFYSRSVVEKDQLRANIILDYPEGDTLYNLPVTAESTYGNSVFPGNYIDIWLKIDRIVEEGDTTSTTEEIMVGKLLENVKVIAVKDSAGSPVFANVDEERTPAMVVFSVPEEYYVLLRKASFLRNYSAEIIPVPTNESLKENPGEITLSNETIKEWINNITYFDESIDQNP